MTINFTIAKVSQVAEQRIKHITKWCSVSVRFYSTVFASYVGLPSMQLLINSLWMIQSELRNVLFWVSFVIRQNVHIKFVSVYQETTKKERKQKKHNIVRLDFSDITQCTCVFFSLLYRCKKMHYSCLKLQLLIYTQYVSCLKIVDS